MVPPPPSKSYHKKILNTQPYPPFLILTTSLKTIYLPPILWKKVSPSFSNLFQLNNFIVLLLLPLSLPLCPSLFLYLSLFLLFSSIQKISFISWAINILNFLLFSALYGFVFAWPALRESVLLQPTTPPPSSPKRKEKLISIRLFLANLVK